MKNKLITKLLALSVLSLSSLLACNKPGASSNEGSQDVSLSSDSDDSEDNALTNVTVNPVDHASALVGIGQFDNNTFNWVYSVEPGASISDYELKEDDKLVIALSCDDGYKITSVVVNNDVISTYNVGDAKAIYDISENGNYVVSLEVVEIHNDSTVTCASDGSYEASYSVFDAEGNEYYELEYDDPDDWNDPGHISFPYSEGTYIEISIMVMDWSYEVSQVLVNGEEVAGFETMLGGMVYVYDVLEAGDYVITATLVPVPTAE